MLKDQYLQLFLGEVGYGRGLGFERFRLTLVIAAASCVMLGRSLVVVQILATLLKAPTSDTRSSV